MSTDNTDKKYLVTAALPYANGPLHIGHLSGAYLSADIFVRYLRMKGKDVVFVCGSDEHGAAITIRAKKEDISPKDIVDKYHHLIKDTFKRIGLSFDMYHRTTEALHHETAQDFFLTLEKKGDEFLKETSEQYYDQTYQQFLADRYIKGTCPVCAHEEAYGDQCENCGSALSPLELKNPYSTLSGEKPVLKATTHWYIRLDRHGEWLREWIKDGVLRGEQHHDPKEWKKHVVGQCLSWLDGELVPRSITRDLDWGIPVPLPEGEGKVLYVWFDAPIGYISATRAWAKANGKNWEDYWKGDNSQLYHFIGKDNIVFHCIIFPSMLKAHGDVSEKKFVLPINVPANQFVNLEGGKMSTSKNWAVWVHEYLDEFEGLPNKEDALRYALIRNMPEQKDSDFTWSGFVEYHDTELVAKLGNFVNRVLSLTQKYYDGVVPEADSALPIKGRDPEQDISLESVKEQVNQHLLNIEQAIEAFEFRNGVREVIELASLGNTVLQHNEPWKLQKTDPDTVKTVMFASLYIAEALSLALYPFLPFSAAQLRDMLNLPQPQNGDWKKFELEGGHQTNKPDYLFQTINDRKDDSRKKLVDAQIEKLEAIRANTVQSDHTPVKEASSFEDFTKLDIRTATIIQAEKVPKANKLLKLTVDLGFEKRTVVSGIAEYFEAEEVIGKQVLLLANLKPRKIRGVESQGMILMAEDSEGKLGFVGPDKGFGNGLTVR